MKLNKKIFIIGIMIIVIIIFFITFFIKSNYKKINIGDNMSNKTLDECKEYIYNISSYEATAEVTIKSNKNENRYLVKQKCINDMYLQEIIEPENVKGVKITYQNNSLTIENTKLRLKKIYEDYPYISENILFLNDFITQYKQNENNSKIEKDNENITVTIKTDNKYKAEEKLYINSSTGLPTKLIVQDNNQKEIIYILYNEIKLNN